ncbi:hypothetical protein ANRL4_01351 [Anaerolineae bacterium]|nr:hypothetical protein ANRL4_01351 [Anaerolineae bacterium]
MVKSQHKIAILIDCDNIPPSIIESVIEKIQELGLVSIRRGYGDWGASNMNSWKEVERTCSIQLKQQSRYVAGKNATDMAIVIDAMDILSSGKIDTFCLVSSDSDFTPLAIRLRDEGCNVIGVGSEKANEAFIKACTQFITTNSFVGASEEKPTAESTKPVSVSPATAPKPTPETPPTTSPKPVMIQPAQKPNSFGFFQQPPTPVKTPSPTPPPKAPKTPNPVPLLKKAYHAAPNEGGWVLLQQLGHHLHLLDAEFKPSKYGHSSLGKLVRAYPDLFEVKGTAAQTYIKLKP